MATNTFTKAFNSIVEAYAVAMYGEVNPAVFTIVTFPFLFGVMFGDVGHGLMLTIAALVIILFEKKFNAMSKHELGQFGMVYRARYLILLMALCSIYMGCIYNEFYAVVMNLSESKYSPATDGSRFWGKTSNATFPFGVDRVATAVRLYSPYSLYTSRVPARTCCVTIIAAQLCNLKNRQG